MLLSSEAGVLHPLPALPKAWQTGRIEGLRVVGNAVCSLAWRDGELERLELVAGSPYRHVLLLPQAGQGYELRLNGRALSVKALLRAGRLRLPQLKAGDRLEVVKKASKRDLR